MQNFAAGLASVMLLSAVDALSAPCWGYGAIVGEPGDYLEDDYENLVAKKIG